MKSFLNTQSASLINQSPQFLMNMKSSSKPKSSPGRTDDFPPPLMMRFPRSKSSSSSSRGSRSRANPMFVRKIDTRDETNQEPSSPKVTCIGQVRSKTSTTGNTAVRRCNWHLKLKPPWFRRVWRKNISIFRCDCGRMPENLHEQQQKKIEANQIECEIGGDSDDFKSESPPRNAFLLTRSRSAPYRSSSLANKFLESTIESEEDERGKNVGRVTEETEGSINGEDEGSINGILEFKAKPHNLSRCKSEPATTGDKVFMSFSS